MKSVLIVSLLAFFMAAYGQSGGYTVIIPSDATIEEKTAGDELSGHLTQATALPVMVKNEKENFAGPAIYVGQTKFAVDKGINFKDFGQEEWLIEAVGKDLVIGGGKPRGAIYGVLEFLERQVGVMWLDENYTYVPKLKELKWPTDLKLHGKPAFDVRGIYAYHHEPQDTRRRFMIRNRQNFFHGESTLTDAGQWGVAPIYGSPGFPVPAHTFYFFTKDWTAAEEECFSLSKDGKRIRATSGSGPGQVCLSSQKTRELFSAKLRETIKADRTANPNNYPLFYSISQNDNDGKCECLHCLEVAKKYNSYGGLMLEFINAIADSIANDYPDVRVDTFAYMFSQKPPKGITARPNVIVRLAQLGSEYGGGVHDTQRPLSNPNNRQVVEELKQWSSIATLGIWDYWILYTPDITPISNISAIPENMKIYRDYRVKVMFAECENPLTNSFYALRLWLGFRMMNNPDLNAEKQIDRFMQAYYGSAAPQMKQYLKYLEQRNNEIKQRLNDVAVKRRTDLDNAFFTRTEELLTAAENAVAGNEAQMRRVGRERITVDRARLDRLELLSPDLKPDRKTVMKRLAKNFRLAGEDYGTGENLQKELQTYLAGLDANIQPPSEFRNCEIVIDLPWTRLNPANRSILVEDITAAGGKAIALKQLKPEEHNGELEFGVYSVTAKQELSSIKISRKNLPQDEKFHFYPVGKITLAEKCYFRVHWTWEIQRSLSEFYQNNGMSNEYEIFASLKVQGPAYVNGSKQENAVLLDRILLIKPVADASPPSGLPLPAELNSRKVAHDLTWLRIKELPAFKVGFESMADAAGNHALKLGSNKDTNHKNPLQYGFYDVANKNMVVVHTIKPKDEKFHLYSLGRVNISQDGYVWVHPSCFIQCNMKDYYQPGGNNEYEIFVSVKAQGPSYVPGSSNEDAVFLDRILLVRP